MTSHNRMVARLAGCTGFIAAAWLPLFVVLFFVIMPARGMDINRFGEPGHVLPFFAAHPGLIRLAGLVNIVGLSAAMLFALLLARLLRSASPALATAGGFLSGLGWLLTLIAETLDLTAYIALPAVFSRDPATAGVAFVTLQTASRMMRTWGYLLAALGVGALGWGMLRGDRWSRGLGILGVVGAPVGILMFLLEYVFVTQTGDAGGGMAQAFTVMFIALAFIVTLWHAWGAVHLRRRASSSLQEQQNE